MPVAHTTPAPAVPVRRKSFLRWVAGGTALAATMTAVTFAVWPASETDKAREDGKQVGQAVSSLYYAQSSSEVDAALGDLQDAVADTRDHAGDAVANQVSDQEDALERAADGFVGVHTSDNAFDVDLYQAELNTAVDDLTSNADDFRAQGPDVQKAFWEGFDEGLTID
jgi:hypothetical protein